MATMLPCQKTIAIPSWSKINHRYALDITKCLNNIYTKKKIHKYMFYST